MAYIQTKSSNPSMTWHKFITLYYANSFNAYAYWTQVSGVYPTDLITGLIANRIIGLYAEYQWFAQH